MCVAAVAAIASIASGVVGAVGAIQQANAQANAANYNAAVAQVNRQNALTLAADARNRGIAAEQDQQLRTRAMLGRQKAVFGSRWIDSGSGSALDIIGDTAMFGKMDALTIRGNAEREAIARETEAANFEAQSHLFTMEASAARKAGGISAFSSLLGSFTSLRSTMG